MPHIVPGESIAPHLPPTWFAAQPGQRIPKRPRRYRRKLKLRQLCAQCGRRWTSMKGCAEFRVARDTEHKYMACLLYQQRCRDCGVYAQPRIYDDEFGDLVHAVARQHDNPVVHCVVRGRKGQPRGFHLDCEACERGIAH